LLISLPSGWHISFSSYAIFFESNAVCERKLAMLFALQNNISIRRHLLHHALFRARTPYLPSSSRYSTKRYAQDFWGSFTWNRRGTIGLIKHSSSCHWRWRALLRSSPSPNVPTSRAWDHFFGAPSPPDHRSDRYIVDNRTIEQSALQPWQIPRRTPSVPLHCWRTRHRTAYSQGRTQDHPERSRCWLGKCFLIIFLVIR